MKPMADFLIEGPTDAGFTILLAHGAGAPMDSNSVTAATAALVATGFRVARFEFDYMAARRIDASRNPPPKAEKLIPEYPSAIETLDVQGPLIIGSKSIGGRVASMHSNMSTYSRCIATQSEKPIWVCRLRRLTAVNGNFLERHAGIELV